MDVLSIAIRIQNDYENQRMDMKKEQYTEETLRMNQVRHALEGHKTLNEALVRCLVQSMSQFKISSNDLISITVNIANGVFGQNWCIPSSDLDCEESSDEESDACESPKPKRRRCGDLTYVMPTRKCLSNYLEDAHYLNLEMLAEYLLNKADSVVTVGIDDATKAAGHDMLHVKGDHITKLDPHRHESHSQQGMLKTYHILVRTVQLLMNSS
ncbi:hypothetical protein LOTGIDRAFT_161016 [Lottia gigantea]|uniref:Uncharacterized protein n=1 Tax=Lottia gigantea TaxID=225164 RepID=V4AD36_LOTGI|nr:hypothetical protein LOTGIDRAFT_161016 [Lottia gigantea]ESO94767.1 hypothetical protein LOTGIDRAFT_161016 [Lottia gigantea]